MHVSQANASLRRSRTHHADSMPKVGELRSSLPQVDEKSALLPTDHQQSQSHARAMYATSGASVSMASSRGSLAQQAMTWREDLAAIRHLVFGQRLNVLLVAAPFAVWAYAAAWSDVWVFTLNFLVLIPLANMLGEATEALAFHTGETIGGLVNATFGNAVEVVVAVFALRQGQIAVVQSSLIGSVLSNLLLVLGCSFIAGGLSTKENKFNATGASSNSSLLMLSSFAMLLPSYLFYFSDHESEETKIQNTLALSHIAAIFLLFMYMQNLFFQLHTHIELFQGESDDDEEMELSKRASSLLLFSATLLVAGFSEMLVSSIDGFAQELHISKSFIGIILLPIVGNAVEHVTAVKVALNDKMELAMGVAVGSATQVSLFVVPVVVIAGWAMGQPMTLAFPQFEIMIYLMSIVIVYAIIADGKSNWLEGSMLVTAYALVAITLIWVHIPSNP